MLPKDYPMVVTECQRYRTLHCYFAKEILTKGSGFSKPLVESQCDIGLVEVEVESNSNTVLSCGDWTSQQDELNIKKTISIGAAKDTRWLGFEAMLMTMKKGETSRFQMLNQESEKMGLCIILVLHNFTDVIPIWQLSPEQKYDLSLQHKDMGTALFKGENVESAFIQYSFAVKYIISVINRSDLEFLDESFQAKCTRLRCICYLNLAACQLKSGNFQSVIENCTKGLALDPWNSKGLYRRALAYKNMGEIREARSDLIKIVKKEPRNKTAADLLETLMPSNSNVSNDNS